MKILIVEDNESLKDVVRETLQRQKYIVESASTYAKALELIELYEYDCILLDIMLPDGSGLDLLRELKSQVHADRHGGVIIISAKGAIDDKIEGLNLGADDYLSKPFNIAELAARVNSVIRRKRNSGELCYAEGNVRVFPEKQQVLIKGQAVEFSKKEYCILAHFIQRSGHVISKENLAEAVWGEYADKCDNYEFIYAQLKNLRKKLIGAEADIEIKSIYGFGYKLVKL